MRKTKFRGYNGVDWLISECIFYNEFPTLNDTQIYMPNVNSTECDTLDIETWDLVWYVGQWTGEKDRNGELVFENDMILYENNIFTVEFIDGCFVLNDNHGRIIPLISIKKDIATLVAVVGIKPYIESVNLPKYKDIRPINKNKIGD